MMYRLLSISLLAGLASCVAIPAQAETPAPAACPLGAVSIYFAAGDVIATPQARAVLGKVGQTARECHPDGVEVVARLDAGEGDRALALALERLTLIADELVAKGMLASQIRMAAEPALNDDEIGPRQIDIVFLKHDEDAPRDVELRGSTVRQTPTQDI